MAQKKLALSLRGGMARAVGYIGLFRALEEAGIEVEMMIGASMGALVGGVYAAGVPLDEMQKMAVSLRLMKELRLESLRDIALLGDEHALRIFDEYIPDELDISDGSPKFWIQVTNLDTLKPTRLDSGPLKRSIIAAIAFPFLFAPMQIDGQTYVDGDLTCGYDNTFLKKQGAEFVLGVTPGDGGRATYGEVNHRNIVNRIVEPHVASMQRIKELDQQVDPVDYLLTDLAPKGTSSLDFTIAEELIQAAYDKTMAIVPDLQRLLHKRELFSFRS